MSVALVAVVEVVFLSQELSILACVVLPGKRKDSAAVPPPPAFATVIDSPVTWCPDSREARHLKGLCSLRSMVRNRGKLARFR